MSPLQYAKKMLRRRTNPLDLLKALVPIDEKLSMLVHAGAHLAQERFHYENAGFRHIVWIEGSPNVSERLAAVLAEHTDNSGVSKTGTRHQCVCSLLSDSSNSEIGLHEFSNDGMSSSIFHSTAEKQKRWPSVQETGRTQLLSSRTLDEVAEEAGVLGSIDALVVDVQGAELLVLKGAQRALESAKAVIAEVSTVPYYRGGVLYPELSEYLGVLGFQPMSVPRRHGDMLFLRADLVRRCQS